MSHQSDQPREVTMKGEDIWPTLLLEGKKGDFILSTNTFILIHFTNEKSSLLVFDLLCF